MLALRKTNIYTFYKDAFPLKILGFYKQMNLHREINKRNLYIDKLIDSFPGTTKEEQSLILNKTYIKKKKSTSMKKKKLIIKLSESYQRRKSRQIPKPISNFVAKDDFFSLTQAPDTCPGKNEKKEKKSKFYSLKYLNGSFMNDSFEKKRIKKRYSNNILITQESKASSNLSNSKIKINNFSKNSKTKKNSSSFSVIPKIEPRKVIINIKDKKDDYYVSKETSKFSIKNFDDTRPQTEANIETKIIRDIGNVKLYRPRRPLCGILKNKRNSLTRSQITKNLKSVII